MVSSIDFYPHTVSYFTFTSILLLTFFLTLNGIRSLRRFPFMAKRGVQLHYFFSVVCAIMSQRSVGIIKYFLEYLLRLTQTLHQRVSIVVFSSLPCLRKRFYSLDVFFLYLFEGGVIEELHMGLENFSALRADAHVHELLIEVSIFSTLIPIFFAISIVQVLMLINEAHINQFLLKASTRRDGVERQAQKIYFTKFDHWMVKIFGLRHISFNIGNKKESFIDFSRSGILRAFFILFIFFLVSSITFTVILLTVKNWDSNAVSKDWYIVWIFVLTSCSAYLCAYPYYVWKARKIDDPYYIWKEHVARAILICIAAFSPILEMFTPTVAKEIRVSGANTLLALFIAFLFMMLVPLVYCYYFLFTMNYRISGLSLNIESFKAMFNDKLMWGEFKKLLAKDFCMENAFFVEEYDRILHKEQLSILETTLQLETHTQTDFSTSHPGPSTVFIFTCKNSLELYEVFLKKDSLYELNISYKTKHAVTEKANSGTLTIDDFQSVYTEVVNSLITNTFPRFISMQKTKTQA